MANSAATGLDIVNLSFSPETGTTICEKLTDCYRQLNESFLNKSFSKSLVAKQTIFISAFNTSEYIERKQNLILYAELFFGELPPTSILAQAPDNDSLVLEILYIQGAKPSEFHRKCDNLATWSVFQSGDIKLLFAAGLCMGLESDDILEHSINSFKLVQHILKEEDMDFSDIVRQWNYIEQITADVIRNNKISQHYQIFNDVRSKYYGLSDFHNGYPAATGIGMDFGGVSIDFIAAKFENNCSVMGIKKSCSARCLFLFKRGAGRKQFDE